jgi:hypothetical protein
MLKLSSSPSIGSHDCGCETFHQLAILGSGVGTLYAA